MLLLGIVEPQLYSSELFCHSGLSWLSYLGSLFPPSRLLNLFHYCPIRNGCLLWFHFSLYDYDFFIFLFIAKYSSSVQVNPTFRK